MKGDRRTALGESEDGTRGDIGSGPSAALLGHR